jgi:hypothetical protein
MQGLIASPVQTFLEGLEGAPFVVTEWVSPVQTFVLGLEGAPFFETDEAPFFGALSLVRGQEQ